MSALMSGPRPLPKARRAGLPLTEKQWQQQVIELATLCGWKHQHQHDSRRSVPGWPDLVLVKPPRIIIIVELKTDRGKVTAEQQEWLDDLAACGIPTHVWRPRDIGQVGYILGSRRRP